MSKFKPGTIEKIIGSILVGGPMVDEIFSTVQGLNFDTCQQFPLEIMTIYPPEIISTILLGKY